jgi:hypothetical protein
MWPGMEQARRLLAPRGAVSLGAWAKLPASRRPRSPSGVVTCGQRCCGDVAGLLSSLAAPPASSQPRRSPRGQAAWPAPPPGRGPAARPGRGTSAAPRPAPPAGGGQRAHPGQVERHPYGFGLLGDAAAWLCFGGIATHTRMTTWEIGFEADGWPGQPADRPSPHGGGRARIR